MIEVHLASVCPTQASNVFTLCLKCPAHPEKVLPILTTSDQVGIIQAITVGKIPPNLVYKALNDLLTQDDFYVAAVQIELRKDGAKIMETADGGQYTTLAGIVRQRNAFGKGEWKSEPIHINASEGIVFAHMFEYPIFVSSELFRTAMTTDSFFNNPVSKGEFKNDLLQNRKENQNEQSEDRASTAQSN